MKHIKITECHFHDLIISNTTFDGRTLKLFLSRDLHNTTCHDFEISIPLDKDENDVSIYYFKQYPRFRKVKLKGKEISFHSFESFFRRKCSLVIVDFLVSTDLNIIVFDCVLFPYSSKPGVYKKIKLEISIDDDYIVFQEK